MSSSLNSATNTAANVSTATHAPTTTKPSTAAAASATSIVSAVSTIISSSKESAASAQPNKRVFTASEEATNPIKVGAASKVPAAVWHYMMTFLNNGDWATCTRLHPLFVTLDDKSDQQWKTFAANYGFTVTGKEDFRRQLHESNRLALDTFFSIREYQQWDQKLSKEEIEWKKKNRLEENNRNLLLRRPVEGITNLIQQRRAIEELIKNEYHRYDNVLTKRCEESDQKELLVGREEIGLSGMYDNSSPKEKSPPRSPKFTLASSPKLSALTAKSKVENASQASAKTKEADEKLDDSSMLAANAPYMDMGGIIEPDSPFSIGAENPTPLDDVAASFQNFVNYGGPGLLLGMPPDDHDLRSFAAIICDLCDLLKDKKISSQMKMQVFWMFIHSRILVEVNNTEFSMIFQSLLQFKEYDLIVPLLKATKLSGRTDSVIEDLILIATEIALTTQFLIPVSTTGEANYQLLACEKVLKQVFKRVLDKECFPDFDIARIKTENGYISFEKLEKVGSPIIAEIKAEKAQADSKETSNSAAVSTSTAAMPVSTSTAASAASANTAAAGSLEDID